MPSEKYPLDITSTDPFEATFSETINADDTLFPGCGPLVCVAEIFACADPPFAACCSGDKAFLCCLESLTLTGEVSGTCDSACVATETVLGLSSGDILCSGTPIAPTGFDPDSAYFIGDVPFTSSYTMLATQVLIYCGGGAARYAFLDASNCVVAEGTISDFACDGSISGTIDASTVMPEACFDSESCLAFLIHLAA